MKKQTNTKNTTKMKTLLKAFGAFCSTLAIIYCLSIGHFIGAALFAVPLYLFSITIQKR